MFLPVQLVIYTLFPKTWTSLSFPIHATACDSRPYDQIGAAAPTLFTGDQSAVQEDSTKYMM